MLFLNEGSENNILSGHYGWVQREGNGRGLHCIQIKLLAKPLKLLKWYRLCDRLAQLT
jgi:hypothetical protein